ncbi:hypothetical protein V8B97DRAFT_1936134 [Scleroderma yunnanense]
MSHPAMLHFDAGYESYLHDTPYSLHSDYEARFYVHPKVKRSFSFEELQSGSCFQSLDESDLQFYRVYGQPVLIPVADDSQDGFTLFDQPDAACSSLHYPYQQEQWSSAPSHRPPFVFKSYALAGSLGDSIAHTHPPTIHSQSSTSIPPYGHNTQQLGSQSSTYPSNFASDHLAGPTASAYEPLSIPSYTSNGVPYVNDSNTIPVPPTVNMHPLIDHHPFSSPAELLSPSVQCLSPTHDESGQSTPFGHTVSAPTSQPPPQPLGGTSSAAVSSGWMDTVPQSRMTVPSQAYPSDDSKTSTSYNQASKGDYVASAQAPRRRTRSPSPRQRARASLINQQQHHGKGRSLDKKPALACLFCRGRKIACGPPLPGNKDKTCHQCARRHLKCEYPLESRRGMRKRRSLVPHTGSATPGLPESSPSVSATNLTSGADETKGEKGPDASAPAKTLFKGRKRSLEKRA